MRCFVLLPVLLSIVSADVVYRNPDPASDVIVISMNPDGITVEFNLVALESESSFLDGFGEGTLFSVPGSGPAGVAGYPDIPGIRRMVKVPDTGDISIDIIAAESYSPGIFNILPCQPLRDRNFSGVQPVRVCTELYLGSETWPAEPVVIESVAILRDLRVAWVRFQPVSWNPLTGEVTVTTSVTARITAGSETGTNELTRCGRGITRSFLPLYREVLGFTENYADVIDGSYVFISSQEGIDLVQDLIDWKHRKGYQVEIGLVPDIGSTPEEIDDWIENAWNTWPNPPEYILLVGDEGVIPSPVFEGFEADNIYGVIGTGCVPSIHMGRICSGDTADLPYMAWKIREHEMNPYQPAVSWFQKGISIGHTEFVANSWDYVEYMMAAGMDPIWFCDIGGIPVTIAALTDSINSGCSIIGLCGHGDITHIYPPGFGNSEVAALSNGRRLPWIALVACQTGRFSGYYCISEAFMSEGDESTPKGAIGVMSPTTNSPYGAADSLTKWIFKGYLQENIHHMGAVTDWSKQEVFAYFGGLAIENNHMHMIFGCPEMDIYYDTAPLVILDCDHPDPVVPGPVILTVTSEGNPLEGALVAVKVYDPSTGSWMDSDYSDASGTVNLVVPSFGAGCNIYVTATAHNHAPYLYESVTGTPESTGTRVLTTSLGVHPSPFSCSTTVSFTVPSSGEASLRLYDISGRMIRELDSGLISAGNHSAVWDGTDGEGARVPAGLYFCRLETSGRSIMKSVVFLR